MNKWMYVLGAVMIAGFAALGMMEMIKAQTPYVTLVSEAGSIKDRPIQFMGKIVREKTRYDSAADELLFQLRDTKGDTIDVRYKGVKPANFDGAERAVVRGACHGNEIVADQILLKCPSKYQRSALPEGCVRGMRREAFYPDAPRPHDYASAQTAFRCIVVRGDPD